MLLAVECEKLRGAISRNIVYNLGRILEKGLGDLRWIDVTFPDFSSFHSRDSRMIAFEKRTMQNALCPLLEEI